MYTAYAPAADTTIRQVVQVELQKMASSKKVRLMMMGSVRHKDVFGLLKKWCGVAQGSVTAEDCPEVSGCMCLGLCLCMYALFHTHNHTRTLTCAHTHTYTHTRTLTPLPEKTNTPLESSQKML
jgi:hypothetical protein